MICTFDHPIRETVHIKVPIVFIAYMKSTVKQIVIIFYRDAQAG